MTELCQKEVAVPIQVRRIAFCPTPLCQLYVEIQWIAKWGMRGLFHNHLIFPPFPTAIGWEKNAFLFCCYDRIMSFGSWIGLKSERIIFSLPLPLWHGYVSWELKSHGKWEVLSALLSLCQDYDKIKWNEEYRIEGQFSPLLSSAVSVLCHADNDFLWTSEGMSSQAQLNNLPTGYAAVDFAMTAIPWIVP